MNFAITVVTSFAEQPAGYSVDALDAMIKETGIDVSDPGSATDDSSNIIVIMNESYTDVKTYMAMIGGKEDPTPYWRSLKENTVHGKVTTSVYGGNTPNSEYEFLTGITCGYLPMGAVPYLQYVDKETYTLPWALKNMGYSTLAMHPYYANGWNRPKVYPKLGFDRFMAMDDFTYTEKDIQRDNYMTDSQAYKNLMMQLDAKPKGQKSFTFLVTVQNHGGYTENFTNFTPKPYVKNLVTGMDTQVNTFLTCLNQSDKALEELIEYLKKKDEKYTLMIFGDHQPNISSFPNNFGIGKNTSWVTPYLIWTNYDMDPELVAKYENDEVGITSVNYLALDVMKAAGIKYPGYFQVIDSIRSEVPQINTSGYYSVSQKKFLPVDDVSDPKDQKAIKLYRYIQYNTAIDKKDNEFRRKVYSVVKSNG
jgi:phosphoglycerol transferase MdoB-like AlkP superfamily enzyme